MRTVYVGSITIRVQVSYYTAPQNNSIVPAFMQQFSNEVTGKQVPGVRVLIAFFVILAAIVAVAVMLFSSLKASIVSIGRNPLASKNIYKSLLQVFVASAVILGAAVGGAYIIMRL